MGRDAILSNGERELTHQELIQFMLVLFVQTQTWVVGLRWITYAGLQLNLLIQTQNSHTIGQEEHLELVITKEHTITLNSLQTELIKYLNVLETWIRLMIQLKV